MPNDATMSDINVLTKIMAKTGINHPTVHKAATMTNVEDLSKAMSDINFEHGQYIYIPPSTSLDDELLLLVGTDLDQFTSSSDISTSTSDPQVFRHAAYKSFEGTIPAKYAHFLDHEGQDLATAALPQDTYELYDLGRGISDVLWTLHQVGETNVVFSPRAHFAYPFWFPDHPINEVILRA